MKGNAIATTSFPLPLLLLVFRLSFGPLRRTLERSFGHDEVYIGCDLLMLGLAGASVVFAVMVLVFIQAKHPKDRGAKQVALGGLLFSILASVIAFVMELAEDLSGPWR